MAMNPTEHEGAPEPPPTPETDKTGKGGAEKPPNEQTQPEKGGPAKGGAEKEGEITATVLDRMDALVDDLSSLIEEVKSIKAQLQQEGVQKEPGPPNA
jgi:hypothetical protein